MKRSARVEVAIRSRDYWYKPLDNQQINWALIEDGGQVGACTMYFLHDLSGVFDRMTFDSHEAAERGLRHNGFSRLADYDDEDANSAPPPPYFEDRHPNGAIYSSRRFWNTPPNLTL